MSSTPLSQLQSRHGLLLRLRLRLLSYFKGALLLNSNKIVKGEFLNMGVQKLEDVFSIVITDLRI
jgi:hypothetical protein